jgi:hypothetical protein
MPTCIPTKRTAKKPTPKQEKRPPRLLKDIGIGPEEAAELRARLSSFAPFWDIPSMDVYDDL